MGNANSTVGWLRSLDDLMEDPEVQSLLLAAKSFGLSQLRAGVKMADQGVKRRMSTNQTCAKLGASFPGEHEACATGKNCLNIDKLAQTQHLVHDPRVSVIKLYLEAFWSIADLASGCRVPSLKMPMRQKRSPRGHTT